MMICVAIPALPYWTKAREQMRRSGESSGLDRLLGRGPSAAAVLMQNSATDSGCPRLHQLDLRKHLQQISIGVSEKQRTMAKGLICRRFEQIDALPHQFVGTTIDVGRRHLEGELKRGTAGGRRGILG